MATFHTILKFVAGHILAGAVIIFGTLFVAFVCYLAGLATAPQGIATPFAVIPEFLMLMFTVSVFAVIVSTSSFLVSALLQWLRSKRHFPVWLPLLLIPVLTFLLVLVMFARTRGMAFVALITGMTFMYFGVYWTLLTSSAAVLDFLRHKLSRQKAG
jgi:hypothetical protein